VRFISDLGSVIPILVAAFVAAALLSLALTPLIRRMAIQGGAVDRPDHRRVNVSPVPRGGGVAVAIATIAVWLVIVTANAALGFVRVPAALSGTEIAALVLGGALAAAVGVLDDAFQLRARWQLGGQVLLALAAVSAGVIVTFVNNPFGPGAIFLFGPVAVLFTVLWIVGMVNSINFIDGLDGLSSGIALIAVVTLGLISLTSALSQPYIAVLCFALAGALLGFLRWNFHPASVFIGTSGVMFVGYSLAVLSILGTAKVAVALLVLGVPIIDTFWIIVRRLSTRRSPFTPDRGHIHHRLLDLGLSHRQTVVLIYGICISLAMLTFILSGTGQLYAFLGLAVVFGLLLFALTRGESQEALQPASYANGDDNARGATGAQPQVQPQAGTAGPGTATPEAGAPSAPPARGAGPGPHESPRSGPA
jgi:UDP-GlcNAc:undecaprenyl-phosphate/decaprenyl-phosphate GlcNAc-1-phosphate transferase